MSKSMSALTHQNFSTAGFASATLVATFIAVASGASGRVLPEAFATARFRSEAVELIGSSRSRTKISRAGAQSSVTSASTWSYQLAAVSDNDFFHRFGRSLESRQRAPDFDDRALIAAHLDDLLI